MFIRDRERERERGGGGEREREESHIKKHNHTGSTGLDTIANPLPNSRTMSSIFPLCVSIVMSKHIIVCLLAAKMYKVVHC